MRQWILLGWLVLGGLVDPRLLGQAWWLRPAAEPLGVLGVGTVEGSLASCADLDRGSEMDRGRGVHPDPGVAANTRAARRKLREITLGYPRLFRRWRWVTTAW